MNEHTQFKIDTSGVDKTPHPLEGKFEPEARDAGTLSEAALTSIAVSLKRIADTIDGTAGGLCVTETLLGGRRND